jgi:hypothetical protein
MFDKIIQPILISLFAVFAPLVPLLLFIGAIIGIDTLFGIIAAKKTGKEIKSSKLARVLSKSLVYMSLVFIFFGMDFILLNQAVMHYWPVEYVVTKLVALCIIGVEIFSIDEKLRMINKGKGLRYYFKMLMSKLKFILASVKDVKDDIDDIEKED